MHFDKHVFISYAHVDNRPIGSETEGWISRFHTSLEAILSMRLGQNAVIWRDDKLQGNDIFGDEIVQQFPETALFVSVLTPRYLQSEWCTREVREFCETARQTGGLVVDNKARIFKVIKTPVDVETQDPLPPEVRGTLGYELYTTDEQDNPLELDPAYGKELEQLYLRKLNCIAWDVVRMLKSLDRNGAPESAEEAGTEKPVVFLAECGHDLHDEREMLEAELKLLGHTVLPGKRLPTTEAEYEAEVRSLLAQSRLSIHVVGESYGWVPDGPSRKSIVVLQNALAATQSRLGILRRIVWLSDTAHATKDPDQKQFVAAVEHDAAVQLGADVYTGDLEGLKATIYDTLQQIEEACRPCVEEEPGEAQRRKVYLICDERDRKQTVALRKFLKVKGFEVDIPLFSGDAETVGEAQKAHLTNCDAVILYYGAGDEAWLFGRENDLKKMKAYRGERPPPVVYTYLAEPMTPDKEEMIELEEPNLIRGLEGFSEEEAERFAAAVTGEAALGEPA